jgi:hypothetical protein
MPRRQPVVKLMLAVHQAWERRDKPGHGPREARRFNPAAIRSTLAWYQPH